MKDHMLVIALLLTASLPSAYAQEPADRVPSPPPGQAWKLVWQDEFNGDRLDLDKWRYAPDAKRRDAWWDRRAVSLDGKGHLVMKTYKDGEKYYDGCITTQGKFEHTFGYYVARVRFHHEPGHWAAFWMMSPGVGKVGNAGRDGTEIDIMEKPWLDDRVQQTLHWDGYGKDHKTDGNVAKVPGVMQGFHTFAIWWSKDQYVFYVDGQETWRSRAGGVSQVPQYMLLSDEVGNWAGDIRHARLPDDFLVDYVRVYDLVPKEETASN